MSPVDQIIFESRFTGKIPVAIFVAYPDGIGPGTQHFGLEASRFVSGILEGADIRCGTWIPQFGGEGVVCFLPVIQGDLPSVLTVLVGALRRCGMAATSWIARRMDSGEWLQLYPHTGSSITIPAEIEIKSAEVLRRESEFAHQIQALEDLQSQAEAGTITQTDFDLRYAAIRERGEALGVKCQS